LRRQMLSLVRRGYRVIGIDWRGHGRSSQLGDGHDMDQYVADAAAVVERRDLRDAVQCWPFHRQRQGRLLRCALGLGSDRQGGADVHRAADHGEDAEQSGWLADRSVRRSALQPGRQPRPVLSGPCRRCMISLTMRIGTSRWVIHSPHSRTHEAWAPNRTLLRSARVHGWGIWTCFRYQGQHGRYRKNNGASSGFVKLSD
jgi:hypothetical protein